MNGSGQEPEAQALGSGRTKKQTSNKDGIRKLKEKLLPGVKYTLLGSLVIYFAMFIVGVLSVKKCPVNEDIPLFLCMLGFVGIASKLVTYLRDRIIPYFKIKYTESALYSTELIFFLLGTYWVFKAYKPSFNPADGPKYCQKTAYMFAFFYLAFFYGLAALLLILVMCTCCCMCMGFGVLAKLNGDEADTNESQSPNINEGARDTTESRT